MMLVWDEANSHLGDREIREELQDVVRRSRKPGMTVAIAGHEWHAVSIPKVVSGRLDRRIAFKTDLQSSRVVLNDPAASELPDNTPGRALMRQNGRLEPVQTFYVDAQRILRDVVQTGSSDAPVVTQPPVIEIPAVDTSTNGRLSRDAARLAERLDNLRSLNQCGMLLTGRNTPPSGQELAERVKPALEELADAGYEHAARLLRRTQGPPAEPTITVWSGSDYTH